MTTLRIVATQQELARLMEEHAHLNLKSLVVGALGEERLNDGDSTDLVVEVPFSMIEEGDWEIRAHPTFEKRSDGKNFGELKWDEVSQGRLRGFFHRLRPDLPRRMDCSWASKNLQEVLRAAYEAKDHLDWAMRTFSDAVIAEGDVVGQALVARLAPLSEETGLVCKDLANMEVLVDYSETPVRMLHDLRTPETEKEVTG